MTNLSLMSRKAWLLAGTVLLPMAATGPAAAQTTSVEESNEPDRVYEDVILVTARKQSESLQDVPVAITAISALELERSGGVGLDGIANLTPGLVFQDLGSGRNQLPTIRGLAQTNLFAAENNVGVFVDGVYISNKSGIDLQLLDIERVEVVKGPQSALFGQSSFAGAINFVTAEPADEFGARVHASIGTDDWVEGRATVEGPLRDNVFGRLTVARRSFDGTFENESDPTNNLQGFETLAINGQLRADLTDKLSANLLLFYNEDLREHGAERLLENNCGGGVVSTYFCGDLPAFDTADITPGAFGIDRRSSFAALTLEYALTPKLMLTSTTAKTNTKTKSLSDFDFTGSGVPLSLLSGGSLVTNTFNSQGDLDTDDIAQEVRLDWMGDRLRLLGGVYYYNGDERTVTVAAVDNTNLPDGDNFTNFFARLVSTDDPFNSPVPIVDRTSTVETLSFFGLAEYDVTDRLSTVFEIRHQSDDKSIVRPNSLGRPGASDEAEFTFTTPKATVQFDLADDAMVYVSAAKGARSGGFNGLFSPLFPDESSFEEEINWTYEIGLKTAFHEGRGIFNAAVFRTEWDNLQIQSESQDPNAFAQPVRNIAGATSTGAEFEFSYRFDSGLSWNLGYAYADPTFNDGAVDLGVASSCGDDTSICTFDDEGRPLVEGNQLGRTNQHQLNTALSYEQSLASGWDMFARIDAFYLSEQPSRSINVQFVPERTVANSQIGLRKDRLEVAVWARNLFDERFAVSQNRQPRFHTGTSTNTVQGDGRIVGVSTTLRF